MFKRNINIIVRKYWIPNNNKNLIEYNKNPIIRKLINLDKQLDNIQYNCKFCNYHIIIQEINAMKVDIIDIIKLVQTKNK